MGQQKRICFIAVVPKLNYAICMVAQKSKPLPNYQKVC